MAITLHNAPTLIPTTYHLYYHPIHGKGLNRGLIIQSIPRSLCPSTPESLSVSPNDSFIYSACVPPDTTTFRSLFKGGLKKHATRYFIKGTHIPDDELVKFTPPDSDWTVDSRIISKMYIESLLSKVVKFGFRGFTLDVPTSGMDISSSFNYGNIPLKFRRTVKFINPSTAEPGDPIKDSRLRGQHYKLLSLMKTDQVGNPIVEPKGLPIVYFTDCEPYNSTWNTHLSKKKIGRIEFDAEAMERVFGENWQRNGVVEPLLFVFSIVLIAEKTKLSESRSSAGRRGGESSFSGGGGGGGGGGGSDD